PALVPREAPARTGPGAGACPTGRWKGRRPGGGGRPPSSRDNRPRPRTRRRPQGPRRNVLRRPPQPGRGKWPPPAPALPRASHRWRRAARRAPAGPGPRRKPGRRRCAPPPPWPGWSNRRLPPAPLRPCVAPAPPSPRHPLLQQDRDLVPVHPLDAAGELGREDLVLAGRLPHLPQHVDGPAEGEDHVSFVGAAHPHYFAEGFAPAPQVRRLGQVVVEIRLGEAQVHPFHLGQELYRPLDEPGVEDPVAAALLPFAGIVVQGDGQRVDFVLAPVVEDAPEEQLRHQELAPVDLGREEPPGGELPVPDVVERRKE